jgi:hypothetical protein
MNLIQWLNDEAEEIILQRDNAFAMLTWRDFNQPAENPFNLQTAAWLFILATGIPVLMLG